MTSMSFVIPKEHTSATGTVANHHTRILQITFPLTASFVDFFSSDVSIFSVFDLLESFVDSTFCSPDSSSVFAG